MNIVLGKIVKQCKNIYIVKLFFICMSKSITIKKLQEETGLKDLKEIKTLLSVLNIYINNIFANLLQVYKDIKEQESKQHPKKLKIEDITPENILGLRKAQNNSDDAIRKLNKNALLLTHFKEYSIAIDNLEGKKDVYSYVEGLESLLRDIEMRNKYISLLKEVAMKI